jgi:UDP-N-acetylmuramoylalanine--D-glutamate ligase
MVEPLVVTELSFLTSWHADWTGVKALVIGLDARTFSVVDTLAELGAAVLVVAPSAPADLARLVPVVGAELDDTVVEDHSPRAGEFGADVVFVASGIASSDPTATWARDTRIPSWTDVDLAWRVRDKVRAAEWLSVTGETGVSLAVDLAVHVIAAAGHRVAGVGAGNVPVLDAVREPDGFDVIVVEFSAADLSRLGDTPISPLASVCIDGDDVPVLGRVYTNTRVACVYNKAVESTMRMVEEAEVIDGCRAIGFDLGMPGPSDLGLVGDLVADRAFHEERRTEALELTTHGELVSAGIGDKVSVTSVLAAAGLVRAFGISPEQVRVALASFPARH